MQAVTLRVVPVEDLHENRGNVREELDGIEELASSIRSNGLLQPVIANEVSGRLVVTDGHRRLRACRLAQVPRIPVLVTTDQPRKNVVTTMLAASMHRQLKPIEQARAFDTLLNEGMTTADIARATGYSLALVKARLLLLELPREVQDMVDDDKLTLGEATKVARQVRANRTGTAAPVATKARWFAHTHRLAKAVALTCNHTDSRVSIGGVGCGPCWEEAIRQDERARGDVA